MDKFTKLLENKAKTQKPMSGPEKSAKLRAVQDMRKMASDEMAMPLKNLKKVTVASNTPEGVQTGLEKAKEMLEGGSEETSESQHEAMMEGDEMGEHSLEEKDPEEMSPEELEMKIAELEKLLSVKKMS
jgi:hypothetical protein